MGFTGDEWVPTTADSSSSEIKYLYNKTAYSDLRSFVVKAKEFPQDDAAFAKLLPRESFKKIEEDGSTIYKTTQDLMVGIGKLNLDFATKKIEKIGTIASDTITYATTAIGYMEDEEKVNLRRYLGVILDAKYAEPGSRDKEYNDAHQGAKNLLSLLKLQADQNKARSDELAHSLRDFLTLTLGPASLPANGHKSKMDYVLKQFRDAPVATSSKVPYSTYLFTDQQKKASDITDKTIERDDKESEWKKYHIIATTAWVVGGAAGLVETGVAAVKATSLRDQINGLKKEIADLKKDAAAVAVLITEINTLLSQCDGIFSKMHAAIDAATDLATLFDNQSQLYDHIGNDLELLGRGLESGMAELRKEFIKSASKDFSVDLRELLGLAKKLSATISTTS